MSAAEPMSLFDIPTEPALAAYRRTDPETSRRAARKAAETAPTLRERVLAHLVRFPPQTDEQIAQFLGAPKDSTSKRRGELVDAGLVEDSGLRGVTARGCSAVRWRATEAGRGAS